MKLLNFRVRDQIHPPRLIYRVRTLNPRFVRHHSSKLVLAALAASLSFSSAGLATAVPDRGLQAEVGCLGCDWAALTAPAPVSAPVRRNLRQVADATAGPVPPASAPPATGALGRVQVPTNYDIRFRGRLNLDPNVLSRRVTDVYQQRTRESSIVPAMQNPYTDPAAVRRLIQDALYHRNYRSRGRCWVKVRESLVRSGMVPPGTILNAEFPRQRVQRLEAAGFRNILDANLAARPQDAPVGSVLIYAHRTNPRDPADAQIRTETGYVNDFYWPTAYTNQSGKSNYRVIGVMVRPR